MNVMKKTCCSALVVAVLSAAAPVRAADGEATKPPVTEVKPITAAIEKSGAELSRQRQQPRTGDRAAAQKVPTSLPKSGTGRIRKQGGNTALIIGLVTTLVGVGATVYMVNEMNKDKDVD
jgi:hypothetical protein